MRQPCGTSKYNRYSKAIWLADDYSRHRLPPMFRVKYRLLGS